jgi:hypothetical protein
LTGAAGTGVAFVLRRPQGKEESFSFSLCHKDLTLPKSGKVSFILFAGFP